MWKDWDGKLQSQPMTAERMIQFGENCKNWLSRSLTKESFGKQLEAIADAAREDGIGVRLVPLDHLDIPEAKNGYLVRMDCYMWNEDGSPVDYCYGRDLLFDSSFQFVDYK